MRNLVPWSCKHEGGNKLAGMSHMLTAPWILCGVPVVSGDWKYAKWSEWISELAKFENTDFSSL